MDSYINSVNLNAGTDFPYLVLNVINKQSFPHNPGFQTMHWHEDLQFIYILEGTIEVKTLENTVTIRQGEGLFINKNVIHHVFSEPPCRYCSFIFPDYFLSFYVGGPAEVLVKRLAGQPLLPLLHFTSQVRWQEHILSILKELFLLEQNKTEFYAYEVLVRLVTLWLEMQKNIALPVSGKANIVNMRMQNFLNFIQEHYAENITLEQLAGSASVSKSECLRCFHASLQLTPYKYLMEYRLSQAARLLVETGESVGNIAAATGFVQNSYFGKCFKGKTGMSPREYRKHYSAEIS